MFLKGIKIWRGRRNWVLAETVYDGRQVSSYLTERIRTNIETGQQQEESMAAKHRHSAVTVHQKRLD